MLFNFHRKIVILMLCLGAVLGTACATFQVGVEPGVTPSPESAVVAILSTPTPSPQAIAPTPISSPEQPQATPAPITLDVQQPESSPTPEPVDSSPLWVAYRDSQHGFGLALPCYWATDTRHGLNSTSSYDYLFALAHSTRSNWTEGVPPDSAFNLDIGVFEYNNSGIAPGTPINEAIPQIIDDAILSMEEVVLGANTALIVHLDPEGMPDYFARQLYFFQLSPEQVLMINPKWQNALDSRDVQAILASISLSPEVPVLMPAAPPEGVVEGRKVYLDEEAGYCFQYPSEYVLEQFTPNDPATLGQVVTLKVERPLYTVGLAVDVQRFFAGLTLEEAVTRFMSQFSGEALQSIQRNPVEVLGGLDFQLGGEPAELLDGVPGPSGSRDIFAMHEDLLYHLVFTPSFQDNPQSAQEANLIYNVVTSTFSFLNQDE